MCKADTVGFVAHCVCKESNLSCEMGMGNGNYRGCQQEYISAMLSGCVWSSQWEHPQISRGIFFAA
jgi:hypothetical protein